MNPHPLAASRLLISFLIFHCCTFLSFSSSGFALWTSRAAAAAAVRDMVAECAFRTRRRPSRLRAVAPAKRARLSQRVLQNKNLRGESRFGKSKQPDLWYGKGGHADPFRGEEVGEQLAAVQIINTLQVQADPACGAFPDLPQTLPAALPTGQS